MEYEVIREIGNRVYEQTFEGMTTWSVLALCADGVERVLYVNEDEEYWE